MRYGKFLPEKGTIGFVAPSFGCNIEPYRSAFINAQKIWEQQGYGFSFGPNAYEGCGIGISNTPQKCAEEFNDWYAKEDVDVLISCGGGELMCEILPYIDFEKIRNSEPKWFLGYSDNTNLIFLLATLCDTAAIYGPCAAAFGMEPWHDSLKDAMGILKGNIKSVHNYEQWEKEGLKTEDNPLEPYNVTEKFQLRTWTAEKGLSIPDDISKKTDEIIAQYTCEEKSLIPIIQGIQEEYRYLPPELLTYVAEKLGISEAKAYSVASFYENFSFEAKGKYVIKVCDGTACHVRKSIPILEGLYKELGLGKKKHTTDDQLFTVETVSCLGACGLAPAVMVNDEVHPKMTPEKMNELIKKLREEEE